MNELIIKKSDNSQKVIAKLKGFREAKTYGKHKPTKDCYLSDFFSCENDNLIDTPLPYIKKVPKQFKTTDPELSDWIAGYGIIYAQDTKEFSDSNRTYQRARDTQLYYTIKTLHRAVDGNWYYDKSLLGEVYSGGRICLCPKEAIVVAKDTNRPICKHNHFEYMGNYYEYEYGMPIYSRTGRPWVFDVTEPKQLTERAFGIEFEYLNGEPLSVELYKHNELRKVYSAVEDGSVRSLGGHEFVSVPLTLSELNYVDEFIGLAKESGGKIDESCGTHVHISYAGYDWRALVRLVRFCKENEEEIFKYVLPSRKGNQYCRQLDSRFNFTEDSIDDCITNFYSGTNTNVENRINDSKWSAGRVRHYWLSLDRIWRFRDEPEKQTIEFRQLQCTQDSGFVKHYINFCWSIVEACQKGDPKKLVDIIPFSKFPDKLELFLEQGKKYESEEV